MSSYSVWNLCNSHCIMCTNPKGFRNVEDSKNYLDKEILERIEGDREDIIKNRREIGLTGGEPTIRPGFVNLLKKIRKRFPDNIIAFATNGRMFAYESFAKELLKVNGLQLQIVIHTAEKDVHDGITKSPGSFDQTVKGLDNFFKYRNKTHRIEMRNVLLKQNYKKIDSTCHLVYSRFPQADRFVLIFPEYEGYAQKNIEKIKITFEEVRPFVEEAIEKWKSKIKEMYLYHFPLCAVSHKYWLYVVRSLPPGYHELFFMKKCKKCFYKESCLGVYKDYVSFFDEEYFSPILKEIPGVKKDTGNYQHPIKEV